MARRIGIVGAGPAGIMAALGAARAGADVLLFDTNDMVGRKILVTGNGRCNISNANAAAALYTSADRHFLEVAFREYGPSPTLSRLGDLGIPVYITPDGWCYPLSNSAANVAAALAAAVELAGVTVHLKTKISDIRPTFDGFDLAAGGPSHTYEVDRVVVATGGKAYPALGSKGHIFPVLESLGHTIVPIRPALVPIVADVKHLHKLQGVRLDVGLTLLEGEGVLGKAAGNMMFTQSGFSGPAAMNLSHLVSARPGADLTLAIDLLSNHRDMLWMELYRWREKAVPVSVALGSLLPPKIAPALLPMAGLSPEVRVTELTLDDQDRLLDLLSHLTVRVRGTRGFDSAQVSTGGVPVTEVEPETMESRVVPGLHLAGEVLDVVGPCGGYNLQFAFTSGVLAGAGASEGP